MFIVIALSAIMIAYYQPSNAWDISMMPTINQSVYAAGSAPTIFIPLTGDYLMFTLLPSAATTTTRKNILALPDSSGKRKLLIKRTDELPVERTWAHLDSSIERGDIVCFPHPNKEGKSIAKRVVGLPGEHIEVRSDGSVFVNGGYLEEPYVLDYSIFRANSTVQYWADIPEHSYYVMGDNRSNSRDSRSFGVVSRDLILSKAKFFLWSVHDPGSEHLHADLAKLHPILAGWADWYHFFSGINFEKTFTPVSWLKPRLYKNLRMPVPRTP